MTFHVGQSAQIDHFRLQTQALAQTSWQACHVVHVAYRARPKSQSGTMQSHNMHSSAASSWTRLYLVDETQARKTRSQESPRLVLARMLSDAADNDESNSLVCHCKHSLTLNLQYPKTNSTSKIPRWLRKSKQYQWVPIDSQVASALRNQIAAVCALSC